MCIFKFSFLRITYSQKVKGQVVADVLNGQNAGTGATWRINAKILSTCRGGAWRHRGGRPPTCVRDRNSGNYEF